MFGCKTLVGKDCHSPPAPQDSGLLPLRAGKDFGSFGAEASDFLKREQEEVERERTKRKERAEFFPAGTATPRIISCCIETAITFDKKYVSGS